MISLTTVYLVQLWTDLQEERILCPYTSLVLYQGNSLYFKIVLHLAVIYLEKIRVNMDNVRIHTGTSYKLRLTII